MTDVIMTMESSELVRFGKNILYFSTEGIILQKTKASKIALLFWQFMLFAAIGTATYFIVEANQSLQWPPTLLGCLILITIVIGIAYFLVRTVRSTYNEWKAYAIVQNGSEILINGKPFTNQANGEVLIKKRVGYEGLGVAYEVYLKHQEKKQVISFGNRLEEAEQVASIISRRFGLLIKRS